MRVAVMIQTAGELKGERARGKRQKKIMNETFGEHSLLDYA